MRHDLPPRWDGHVVVWDGWRTLPPAHLCPPPAPSCCRACGSLTDPVTNRGRVAVSAVITHERIAADDAARDRLPVLLRHKIKARALYRLTAFRCPDCRHDIVTDIESGETWDLDPSDYGDAGSVEAVPLVLF